MEMGLDTNTAKNILKRVSIFVLPLPHLSVRHDSYSSDTDYDSGNDTYHIEDDNNEVYENKVYNILDSLPEFKQLTNLDIDNRLDENLTTLIFNNCVPN